MTLDELRAHIQKLALGNMPPIQGPVQAAGMGIQPPPVAPTPLPGSPMELLNSIQPPPGMPTPAPSSLPYGYDPEEYARSAAAYQSGVQAAPPVTDARILPDMDQADNIEVARSQSTLDRSRGEAERLGVELPEEDPSMVNRIFDVLSRGQYMTAEAARRIGEGTREDGFDLGDIGEAAKGAVGGLMGKHKTSFSDVIEEAGVENKWVRGIGGFAGDVLLDPTTYIGVGLVKAATKEAAKGVAAKAAQKAVNDAGLKKSIADEIISKHAEKLAKQAGPGYKGKKVGSLTQSKLDKQVAEAVRKEARNTFKAVEKQVLEDGKGALNFKFMGKDIGSSVKLYEGGRKVTRKIAEIPAVKTINWNLRPLAQLGDLHELSRVHEGRSYADFHRGVQPWLEKTAHVTEDQGALISKMMEEGRIHELPDELQDVALEARKLLDDWWQDEFAVGIHKSDADFVQNYVPHVYKSGDDIVDQFKKQWKNAKHSNRRPGFAQQRSMATMEEAKAAGLKLDENIVNIIHHRAAKHYQEINRRSFFEDAMTNFGFFIKSDADKKMHSAIKKADALGKKALGEGLELAEYYGMKAYVPTGIKKALDELDTMDPSKISALGKRFDKIQQAMKAGFTVYRLGHHFRNIIGDIFLGFQGGVVNPKHYGRAIEMIAANRKPLGSPEWNALAQKKVRIGDRMVDLRQMDDLYRKAGLKTGFTGTDITRHSNHKAGQVVRDFSENREDFARYAHFLDSMNKYGKKAKNVDPVKLEELALKAAKDVRKYHFDYGDLTKFEKQLRRYVMFYTFARKNLPLQIEMALTKPGRVAAVPKTMSAIETLLGTEEKSPTYEDQIPEWLRDTGNPQIGKAGSLINRILGTDDEVFTSMLLPTNDLNRIPTKLGNAPSEISNQILSELRPELKGIGEMGTGVSSFSGAPVGGPGEYGLSQLPFAHFIKKLIDPELTTQEKTLAGVNELTGMGIQIATDNRKRGELKRRQDPLRELIGEKKKLNTEEFLKAIRGQ